MINYLTVSYSIRWVFLLLRFAFLLPSLLVPWRFHLIFLNGRVTKAFGVGNFHARVKKESEDSAHFLVGEDVPGELLKQQAIYDMILVERY
jgi:hypothetical protein